MELIYLIDRINNKTGNKAKEWIMKPRRNRTQSKEMKIIQQLQRPSEFVGSLIESLRSTSTTVQKYNKMRGQ